MSISIEKRGPIVVTVETRLKDLLEFINQNQDRNKYVTKEMSPYDYSCLKAAIEVIVDQLEE